MLSVPHHPYQMLRGSLQITGRTTKTPTTISKTCWSGGKGVQAVLPPLRITELDDVLRLWKFHQGHIQVLRDTKLIQFGGPVFKQRIKIRNTKLGRNLGMHLP